MPQGHSQKIDLPDLPSEVWGEIAGFATRDSVLNLRTASIFLKAEAETAITSMTVSSSANLRALAEASSFNHLHTLHINHADSASLQHFAAHLVERFHGAFGQVESATHTMRTDAPLTIDPVCWPKITLSHGRGDLTDALIELSALPLAALRLDNIYPLETPALAAFARSHFPLEISGRFHRDKLVALSDIPTLTALYTNARHFDDEVAHLFSSHPALQTLTLGGVHCLAAIAANAVDTAITSVLTSTFRFLLSFKRRCIIYRPLYGFRQRAKTHYLLSARCRRRGNRFHHALDKTLAFGLPLFHDSTQRQRIQRTITPSPLPLRADIPTISFSRTTYSAAKIREHRGRLADVPLHAQHRA
jgi:hypothetical protein